MVGISHIFSCVLVTLTLGDPGANAASSDDVNFYLSGTLSERQKLRSGVYAIRGTRSFKDGQIPNSNLSGDVAIFCAFDESRVRLDNVEGVFTTKRDLTTIRRKYFRTDDESAVWLADKKTIWIQKPNAVMAGQFLFLDARAVGITTWNYVNDSRGSKLEKTISAYASGASQKSVEKMDDNLVQLVFVSNFTGRREELRLWIAPAQGYTVRLLESRTWTGDGKSEGWQVNERTITSWKEINGAWVPVASDMRKFRQTAEQGLDLKFDWQAVNEAVDAKYFTPAGFNTSEATRIVDTRGDEPVVVRDPR